MAAARWLRPSRGSRRACGSACKPMIINAARPTSVPPRWWRPGRPGSGPARSSRRAGRPARGLRGGILWYDSLPHGAELAAVRAWVVGRLGPAGYIVLALLGILALLGVLLVMLGAWAA